MSRTIVRLVMLAAVLAVALWMRLAPHAPPTVRGATSPVATAPATAPAAQTHGFGPAVGFQSRERWMEHFQKHGAELGCTSPEEYLRRAQALRDRPAAGDVLEAVRGDGVVTRFDRASGLFVAFGEDGVLRTCFRPHDGESYFRRQLEREH